MCVARKQHHPCQHDISSSRALHSLHITACLTSRQRIPLFLSFFIEWRSLFSFLSVNRYWVKVCVCRGLQPPYQKKEERKNGRTEIRSDVRKVEYKVNPFSSKRKRWTEGGEREEKDITLGSITGCHTRDLHPETADMSIISERL